MATSTLPNGRRVAMSRIQICSGVALSMGAASARCRLLRAPWNHQFWPAKTGARAEYGELVPGYVPGFLETLGEWIAAVPPAGSAGSSEAGAAPQAHIRGRPQKLPGKPSPPHRRRVARPRRVD